MNEVMNELMLVVSTISSLLAGITAIAAEMRMRRRGRIGADASQKT